MTGTTGAASCSATASTTSSSSPSSRAQTIVELTGSRSEIVFEALPVDDPQVRQPDITKARDLLGWEPEIDLRSGLAQTIEHYTKVLGQPASQ